MLIMIRIFALTAVAVMMTDYRKLLSNVTANANFETELASWLIDSKCSRQNGYKLIDVLFKNEYEHLKSSRTFRATLIPYTKNANKHK